MLCGGNPNNIIVHEVNGGIVNVKTCLIFMIYQSMGSEYPYRISFREQKNLGIKIFSFEEAVQ